MSGLLVLRQVTEVTSRSFWGLRSVEDLEIILGIKYFNYFFFFFFFLFFFLFNDWL